MKKEKEVEKQNAEEERILQKTGHVKKTEVKKQKVYRPSGVGKYIPSNIVNG